MFADRAKIYVRSGKGGDGGTGGSVIFEIDEGMNTLSDYRHVRKYCAEHGENGGKRNCTGKNGKDIVLKVPEGTVVKEAESGKVITDMSGDNKRVTVLKGGKGGKGNAKFANSRNQTPKIAENGDDGEEYNIIIYMICLIMSWN